MNSPTILKLCLEETGHQLNKILEHLSQDLLNIKVSAQALSPKEIFVHLCDAYRGYLAATSKQNYIWENFDLKEPSVECLKETFLHWRQKAVEQALSFKNTQEAFLALQYLCLHESYHIGQLCLAYKEHLPNFDPYFIYRHYTSKKANAV